MRMSLEKGGMGCSRRCSLWSCHTYWSLPTRGCWLKADDAVTDQTSNPRRWSPTGYEHIHYVVISFSLLFLYNAINMNNMLLTITFTSRQYCVIYQVTDDVNVLDCLKPETQN
jgi:hypothetical protein